MGSTLNFIDISLKLFEDNYYARCVSYSTDMKEIFKQIHLMIIKALTTKQKVQKLMTEISGGWCMGKSAKGIPPLRISILSKEAKDKEVGFKKNYMKLIIGGMIGNSNYIGTSLNGSIQEVEQKIINPFQFVQKKFT